MNNKNGKYESGKYHTIEITKNVGITINDERVRLGIKKKNDKELFLFAMAYGFKNKMRVPFKKRDGFFLENITSFFL